MKPHRRRTLGFSALALGLGLSLAAATTAIAAPSTTDSALSTPPLAGSYVGADDIAKPAGPSLDPSAEWTAIADLPVGVQDTAAAWVDGRSYVLGGYSAAILHATDAGHAYDSTTGQWNPIADLPIAVMQARAAVVEGVIYLFGGWSDTGTLDSVHAYDPGTDSWTHKTPMPEARAASGIAVVDGQIHLIGGCASADPSVCTPDTAARSYDPATDTWSELPDYPVPFAHGACGGVAGTAVCAGGLTDDSGAASTATYALDGGAWQPRAELPGTLWGMASTAANGQLIVSNGLFNGNNPTAQTLGYDPAANAWTELPNAGQAAFRGSMSCGLVKAGGRFDMTIATAETLDGYTDCAG